MELGKNITTKAVKTLFMYPPSSIRDWIKTGIEPYTGTFHRCTVHCQQVLLEDCYRDGETVVEDCGRRYENDTIFKAALEAAKASAEADGSSS